MTNEPTLVGPLTPQLDALTTRPLQGVQSTGWFIVFVYLLLWVSFKV